MHWGQVSVWPIFSPRLSGKQLSDNPSVFISPFGSHVQHLSIKIHVTLYVLAKCVCSHVITKFDTSHVLANHTSALIYIAIFLKKKNYRNAYIAKLIKLLYIAIFWT